MGTHPIFVRFRLSNSMLRIVARRSLVLTVQKRMDPIQAIFVNKIREYAAQSGAGPVGADAAFQQERADIQERLSRTYGGGDMESFQPSTSLSQIFTKMPSTVKEPLTSKLAHNLFAIANRLILVQMFIPFDSDES